MRLYTLNFPENSRRYGMPKGLRFDGTPKLQKWNPPQLTLERDGIATDTMGLFIDSSAFLATSSTVEIINKEFGPVVEWLPAQADIGVLYFANCLNVVDFVDMDRSVVELYKDGGIESVKAYVAKIEPLKRYPILKWSEGTYPLYLTDRFVRFLNSARLTGMDPDPIWDSEVAPFSRYPSRAEIAARPEVFGPNGFRGGFEHAWPEEWKPLRKRSPSGKPSSPPKPTSPTVQVSDCTVDELDWIEQRHQAGMALLSLNAGQVRKDAVDAVRDWVKGKHPARPVGPPSAATMPSTDAIDAVATVAGQAFVEQFGWTWRAVDAGDDHGRKLVAMASDGFYIDPWREIERSLVVPPAGERAAVFGIPMVFNMMAAGEYPEITVPGFLALNLMDRLVRLV